MLRGFLFFHFSLCIKTPIYDTPPWPSLNFICKSPGGGWCGWIFVEATPNCRRFFRTPLHPPSFSHLPGQVHWEIAIIEKLLQEKSHCQIFKGSIGNNQKLAQDQSNIQATFSKFPSKNTKKKHFLVVKMNMSSLQKFFQPPKDRIKHILSTEPQVPPPVAVPMAWKKWLLQKNLPKNGKGWKLKPWKT